MSSITLHSYMLEVYSLCFCLSLNNTFGASPKNMNVFSPHPDRDSHIKNIKVKGQSSLIMDRASAIFQSVA